MTPLSKVGGEALIWLLSIIHYNPKNVFDENNIISQQIHRYNFAKFFFVPV